MPSSPASTSSNRSLVVEGLKKTYGSTQALRGLSLTAEANRIVGVVGPNGAGKSTLVRILAGEETEDAGTIAVGGKPVAVDQRRRLVAVVHQEPQLFPNLSVVENLMIDRQGLRRPKPTSQVFELLEGLHIGTVANAPLENTSIMVWQLTEIARALLRSAEVFLFDEPNSALTKDESQRLFEQMEALCNDGKFVFLVSHRLGEIADVCRQVLVVRDGAVVASLSEDAVTSDRLSSLLIAEEFGDSTDPVRTTGAASLRPSEVLQHEADDPVGSTGAVVPSPGGPSLVTPAHNKSLDLQSEVQDAIQGVPGLVVAVTGPEGGGGRELARAAGLAGLLGQDSGRGGRAYMPADRRQCLFFNMSVAANISARVVRAQLPGEKRFVNRRVLARASESYIERFSIKTESATASVGSLSGGNQQKVALASALAVEPALLIVEEPTRGVDVKTKLQIYEILRSFATSGGAVVMFVNELEDALGCADVLYVVTDRVVCGRVEVTENDDLEQLGLTVNRLLSRRNDAA